MRALTNRAVALVLLGCLSVAHAADLPSAPSSVQKPQKAVCGLLPEPTFAPVPPVARSWQTRHKRAIIITGIVLGAAAGTGIAYATRRGTCEPYIIVNGVRQPYSGTPPCPVDQTPGTRRK